MSLCFGLHWSSHMVNYRSELGCFAFRIRKLKRFLVSRTLSLDFTSRYLLTILLCCSQMIFAPSLRKDFEVLGWIAQGHTDLARNVCRKFALNTWRISLRFMEINLKCCSDHKTRPIFSLIPLRSQLHFYNHWLCINVPWFRLPHHIIVYSKDKWTRNDGRSPLT